MAKEKRIGITQLVKHSKLARLLQEVALSEVVRKYYDKNAEREWGRLAV